ncbi:MAG: ComF family protein [Muribaculaceae bacterium]|nr:ComF family protein [Muribaculaceae bacterium]
MGERLKSLKEWIDPLLSVIFPDVCEICGSTLVPGEMLLCSHCLHAMPRLNLFTNKFNDIHHRLFSTHSHIDKAAALYAYHRHDEYAEVILTMKYRNRPDIGEKLGMMLAREADQYGFFNGVDMLLPVPMHWWKKLRRGYNQSEEIARGISKVTGIPVRNYLKAARKHGTQTHRTAKMRWENTKGIYSVRKTDLLEGKHVMLIDDVITTGSTLLHCSEALAKSVSNINISVCTVAATHLN